MTKFEKIEITFKLIIAIGVGYLIYLWDKIILL